MRARISGSGGSSCVNPYETDPNSAQAMVTSNWGILGPWIFSCKFGLLGFVRKKDYPAQVRRPVGVEALV